MSKAKRTRYSAEFKSKVALEALREELTLSELSAKYNVHPNQISKWKKEAIEGMATIFSNKSSKSEEISEAEIKDLHAKIGQLTVERDFLQRAFGTVSISRRKFMIENSGSKLSISKQCRLLSISRSSFYYQESGESALNLELMRIIDEQFMMSPDFGSRQMTKVLQRYGYNVGRKRVRRLMKKMGIEAVYQKPKTSNPHPEHKKYPYLLRGLDIDRPNQVWCSDITYIPMRRGFLYLVAIMDWYSRKVLTWRLSNSLDSDFCVAALEDALEKYGTPEIFNTDQGSQFTSYEFTQTLKDAGVKISMDGRGRWMDNVMIERIWRTLKYGFVYLHAFDNGHDLKRGLGSWINMYNTRRPHSSLGDRTPYEAYNGLEIQIWEKDDRMTESLHLISV
nr:IS3 family transposase [Denitrovibrio acetiphilus]